MVHRRPLDGDISVGRFPYRNGLRDCPRFALVVMLEYVKSADPTSAVVAKTLATHCAGVHFPSCSSISCWIIRSNVSRKAVAGFSNLSISPSMTVKRENI